MLKKVGLLALALVLLVAVAVWLLSRRAEGRSADRPQHWAKPLEVRPGLDNLFQVSDVLYRGAQPEPEGFAELARLGVRTVVNLRTSRSDGEPCTDAGLNCVQITMQAWEGEAEELVEFLRVISNPDNHPVFVHCRHGSDRTGVATAAYRLAVQEWSKDDAIAEMTEGGFGFHLVWQNLIRFVRDLDVERVKQQAGLDS